MSLRSAINRFISFLRLSREGLAWLALCLGMLSTGLFKSINLITLLACILLAAILCNFWLARRQLRKLIVRRELPAVSHVDEETLWKVRVVPDNRRPRLGLRIVEAGLGQPIERFVEVIPTTGAAVEARARPDRRGVFPLGPITVGSGHPLGLVAMRREYRVEGSLFVAPRLGTVHRGRLRHWLARYCSSIGAVRSFPLRHPTGQTEFHGLRRYRPGDNPRWIHWPTSARKNTLMVREFEEYPNDDLVLIVDTTAKIAAELFERMLSVAASICREWCRQTGDRLVLAIAGPKPTETRGVTGPLLLVDALRLLAAVEPPGSSESPNGIASLLETPIPPTAHLVLSVGPSRLPELLRETVRQSIAVVDIGAHEEDDFFELPAAAGWRSAEIVTG
jgi:uncharacterized protein (DUF58 family)